MKRDKKKEKIYKGQVAEKEDCPLKKRTDGNPVVEGPLMCRLRQPVVYPQEELNEMLLRQPP